MCQSVSLISNGHSTPFRAPGRSRRRVSRGDKNQADPAHLVKIVILGHGIAAPRGANQMLARLLVEMQFLRANYALNISLSQERSMNK